MLLSQRVRQLLRWRRGVRRALPRYRHWSSQIDPTILSNGYRKIHVTGAHEWHLKLTRHLWQRHLDELEPPSLHDLAVAALGEEEGFIGSAALRPSKDTSRLKLTRTDVTHAKRRAIRRIHAGSDPSRSISFSQVAAVRSISLVS